MLIPVILFVIYLLLMVLKNMDEELLKFSLPLFALALFIFAIYWILKISKENKQAREKANHYFTALKRSLGAPYPTFHLREEDRQYLIDNDFTGEAIYYHLVVPFMTHLNAPFTMFNINVTDGKNSNIAGAYSTLKNIPTIDILIKPEYNIEQIIATVCHECMHHYLRIKKIRGRTVEANEKLTDYACIYTGFEDLLYRGYTVVETNNGLMDTWTKVGYLTKKEVNVAIKCLKNFK